MKTNYEHYKEEIIDYKGNGNIDCFIFVKRTDEKVCNGNCYACLMKSVSWLFSEYKEPIQMTLFEKSILECAVEHGYEWIARNKNGVLWFSKRKPIRDYYDGGSSDWYGDIEAEKTKLFSNKFQFIKWEDADATHIPALLKEAKIKEGE